MQKRSQEQSQAVALKVDEDFSLFRRTVLLQRLSQSNNSDQERSTQNTADTDNWPTSSVESFETPPLSRHAG
ncbi:hypothetical protein KOR42_41240 [Thalassoglobus neptunius]|uniref:Uncharacterized protein n=1 Tax=Thalassoglobus neptunius TaxID=1938619 RepID=A0A5C5W8A9_9PLAN|nr:hypothetical protein [Thalassoglobus neptunius]TWT47126.1 hypothetical protein KOR42_41240 [Thalassoglobus neptunius]